MWSGHDGYLRDLGSDHSVELRMWEAGVGALRCAMRLCEHHDDLGGGVVGDQGQRPAWPAVLFRE